MPASTKLMTAAAALFLSFVAAVWLIDALPLSLAARLLVALLPIGAFTWFMVVEIRIIRAMDELEQRIQLEALAVAYPAGILLVFAVGFLERAGLPLPGFERTRDMWPLTLLPYFAGIALAVRRYR